MNSTPDNQNDGFASDIFGVSEYAPELPKKKDFLPWHKPRKQFIRQKQWCDQILKMIEEFIPENNILKYLGLPGDDLLDLRYFHKYICEPKNIRLKFLGFNHGANPMAADSSELNISLDEVSKLPFVDPSSDVIGDDICRIANANSIAYNRSIKMGPYDVINIDLCDGFGKHPINQFEETHYNTLMHLMTLQARRPNPWLLLLTTRTGSQHINQEIVEKLKGLYGQNLIDCEAFLNLSNEKLAINNPETLKQACTSQKGLSDVFLTSICKWIANIALAQAPPSKVEVKSVLGYKVTPDAEHQDLISVAIKIEPTLITLPDKMGLANQQLPAPSECSMAVQILNRIVNQKDVDGILQNNSDLMNEMIGMSSRLLEEARYDVSNYDVWAKQN